MRRRRLLNTHHTRTSPNHPAFYTQDGIAAAYQIMVHVVEHATQDLDLEEYLRARGYFAERNKIDLSLKMYDAFMTAFRQDKHQYPRAAIRHSVAMILAHFDIEQGDLDTIAARIASRRRPQRRRQR